MPKPLVIVESPAKARTIAGFLGRDYTVMASMGHVRDLPAKGLNVDVDNDFKVDYEVNANKKDVIRDLKRIHGHVASIGYPILESANALRESRLAEVQHSRQESGGPARAPQAGG